jgi:hypothetical protein
MKEIRLIRSCTQGGQAPSEANASGGVWHPATQGNREALDTIARAGNQAYGEGTHWVLERQRKIPADAASKRPETRSPVRA